MTWQEVYEEDGGAALSHRDSSSSPPHPEDREDREETMLVFAVTNVCLCSYVFACNSPKRNTLCFLIPKISEVTHGSCVLVV